MLSLTLQNRKGNSTIYMLGTSNNLQTYLVDVLLYLVPREQLVVGVREGGAESSVGVLVVPQLLQLGVAQHDVVLLNQGLQDAEECESLRVWSLTEYGLNSPLFHCAKAVTVSRDFQGDTSVIRTRIGKVCYSISTF